MVVLDYVWSIDRWTSWRFRTSTLCPGWMIWWIIWLGSNIFQDRSKIGIRSNLGESWRCVEDNI